GLQILDEVLRPDRFPGLRLQAPEVTHRSERVDLVADDGRRGPRAERVADLLVRAVVLVFPNLLAGVFVQAHDALLARRGRGPGRLFSDRAGDPVHTVDEPAGHRRPAVTGPERRLPHLLRTVLGEFVEDALLAPDAIALWAEPLRPVVPASWGD